MAEDIPEWAKVRAWDILFPRSTDTRESIKVREMSHLEHRLNVARYIAEHEEPPVDPLDAAIDEAWVKLPGEWTRETFVKHVGDILRTHGACIEKSS